MPAYPARVTTKGPSIGLQTYKAFVGGARHQQREDISVLRMRRAFAFIIADHITLIAPALIDKICRLVHVIPNSRDPVIGVSSMKIAPPLPRVGFGVIHEHTVTRPNARDEQGALLAALKMTACETLIENMI